MNRRPFSRRLDKLASVLGGDPTSPRADCQRSHASVARGLADLHRWIASGYRDLPPEEQRSGRLGRVRAMIDAGLELLAQPVLERLLEAGHDDPSTLSPTTLLEALRANDWLHDERHMPAPDFGLAAPDAEDAALLERRAAAEQPLPDDRMPSAWLELSAQLAVLDAEGHPAIIGAQTEPSLDAAAFL